MDRLEHEQPDNVNRLNSCYFRSFRVNIKTPNAREIRFNAMNKSQRNQVIALAGLMQAVLMVQQIARKGRADPVDLQACIESALKIDAVDVDDVYGGISRLESGLRAFISQLDGMPDIDRELTRYASLIIFHERRLLRQDDTLEKVRSGVERAALQAERLGSLHENVIGTLAETYLDTISQFKPRVMIEGEPVYLSNAENGKIIRALLLAAMRSAVLWRQCGGSRFSLLFRRYSLQREAKSLLDEIRR